MYVRVGAYLCVCIFKVRIRDVIVDTHKSICEYVCVGGFVFKSGRVCPCVFSVRAVYVCVIAIYIPVCFIRVCCVKSARSEFGTGAGRNGFLMKFE